MENGDDLPPGNGLAGREYSRGGAVHQLGGGDLHHSGGIPGVRRHVPESTCTVPDGQSAFQQISGSILGQFPEAEASQSLFFGKGNFGGDGGLIVIGEKDPIPHEVGYFRLSVANLPIGSVVQIRPLNGVIGNGFPVGIAAVQSAVVDALIYVTEHRQSQQQLIRWHSPFQPGGNGGVHASAVPSMQRGVEACGGLPGIVKVIGHQENMVHCLRHGLRLNVVEIAGGEAPSDGKAVALPVLLALLIQLLAKGLQQQGKVLFVLESMRPGPAGDGIFPIQVDAVQIVGQQQVQAALSKRLPPLSGGCSVREAAKPVPAPQGEDDFQVRVPLPQGRQALEIF